MVHSNIKLLWAYGAGQPCPVAHGGEGQFCYSCCHEDTHTRGEGGAEGKYRDFRSARDVEGNY